MNTKFHYMEVIATLENYKISLFISKITVKQKPFFTLTYTLSRQKTTRKGKRNRGRESDKEKGREGEKEREEEKEKDKEKEKMEKAVLKSFFKHTAPSGYVP